MSKMFKSTKQTDSRKVLAKFLDVKRECYSRLRYLKEFLVSKDGPNEKQFFYNHRSTIYAIFFEGFIQLDAAKHRGSGTKGFGISDYIGQDGINSGQRDDLEIVLYIFEKILLLLPEILEQRWQLNSIVFVFRKMLHYSNVLRIRHDGLRLFLQYYQILGERVVREYPQIEVLYAALIPGLVSDLVPNLNPRNPVVLSGPITTQHLSEFPDLNNPAPPLGSQGPVQPFPNEPFIPMLMHDHGAGSASQLVQAANSIVSGSAGQSPAIYQPTFEFKPEVQRYFLELLLDYSISQCQKIVWGDYRDRRAHRAFEYLMFSFSRVYMPYIFPKMAVLINPDRSSGTPKSWPVYTIHPIISVYGNAPSDKIPTLRRYSEHLRQYFVYSPLTGTPVLSPLVQLQTIVIQWFSKYLLDPERNADLGATLVPSSGYYPSQTMSSSSSTLTQDGTSSGGGKSHSVTSLNLQGASYPTQANFYHQPPTPQYQFEREFVRSLLNSKRIYVDLILSLFHETLLLPFLVEQPPDHHHSKDRNSSDPTRTPMRNVIKVFRQWINKDTSTPLPVFLAEPITPSSPGSTARYGTNDDQIYAGLMNFLNVFILSTANVFLLEVPPEQSNVLELQVDVCKRVFNIYRFMVMKVDMDRFVWENLVQVLIQITRSIVSREIPLKREDTLGGRLAPALFQTLIVTWIKANLNVAISPALWDAFHQLVSSLTRWEELINEWSNTMYILNRVMSRYVFNINLSDLPLEKVGNDRKKRMLKSGQSPAGQGNSGLSRIMKEKNAKEGSPVSSNSHHQPDSGNVPSSGRNPSVVSGISLQRFPSNDPNQPQPPPRSRRAPSAYQPSNLPFQSVVRHRQFHITSSTVRAGNLARHRSLSDSCLALSVQSSLCPVRGLGRNLGSVAPRSFASQGPRSKRSSQKSNSHRNSPRQSSNRNGPTNASQHHQPTSRNLPMIDDDDLHDDFGENCTIADCPEDFSDASSTVDSAMDGYFNYDGYQESNVYGVQYYGPKHRTLYRSYSSEDINHVTVPNGLPTSVSGGAGNTTPGPGDRAYSIYSESISLGAGTQHGPDGNRDGFGDHGSGTSSTCSSSVAEAMSISGISGNSVPVSKSQDTRPILLGGTYKGWNAEISVVLWRRMLGVLGDLNDIPDPTMHKLAFESLVKITDDFIKMKDNISYLMSNNNHQGSLQDPNSQPLQPSLHHFTAWLFRATTLSNEFKAGKLLAYKLLCIIALQRCEQCGVANTSDTNIKASQNGPEAQNRDFLILFYLAIKRALSTYDMELTCIIIKYCGQKFFSSALYGSSCLLFDFISAANMIVSSQETKWPRAEALHLLGSLIGFFDVYSNVLILRNTTTAPSLETYKDLKEHVLEILIIASKREQTGLGRSIALCSLGIFLYKEFQNRTEHHRLKEIVNILIAGTRVSVKRPKLSSTTSPTSPSPNNLDNTSKFNNRVLCRVACDQLRLQTDHAAYLVEKHPDIARRIIEGFCYTLSLHVEVVQQQNIFKEFKHLLISIQFTLAQWCMSVSKDFLAGTLVSRDYPNFVDSESNSPKKPQSSEDSDPPKSQTLLELVISVFSSIANLNIQEILQRRYDPRQMDNLNGAYSFSDMETMDYTIAPTVAGSDSTDGSSFSSPARANQGPPLDTRSADANTVKRAAQLILLHFMTFVGHFPVPKLRTSSLCALINESDDNPCAASNQSDKLELETLNSPNVLVFIVNSSCIISFVELSPDSIDSAILSKLSSSTSNVTSSLNIQKQRPIRIIIRNLLGKFSWNCVALQAPLLPDSVVSKTSAIHNKNKPEPMIRSIATSNGHYQRGSIDDYPHPSPHHHIIHHDDSLDPDSDDDEKSDSFQASLRKDSLETLIGELYELTPECRPTTPEGGNFLQVLNSTPEAVDIVALFTNQHYQERQFHEDMRYRKQSKLAIAQESTNISSSVGGSTSSGSSQSGGSTSNLFSDPSVAFQQCRQLVEQTGFLSWEKRSQIELLSKSTSMLRELRHLDAQRCRETHKIAVIYVGQGQETKDAILQNKSGSRPFEEFVSKLGWEVNLASHVGFMGGLESNLSTGLTAPYFADSFNEVIFHVSTRLEPVNQSSSGDSSMDLSQQQQSSPEKSQLMNKKMRHLGNDEVHIVWSDHFKEYRRTALATEFCDALIVIYPLPAQTYPNLYRIQVSRKPDVPFFGPLFNGVVLHRDELPALVRATAINASRAKRAYMPAYKHYFEERFDSIQSLGSKHYDKNTFEEYATRIYAPRYDLLSSEHSTPTDSGYQGIGDSTGVESGTTPSIEQFLNSTGGWLSGQSMSPSNADSISIASTNTSVTVDTPQSGSQQQTPPLHHQYHQYSSVGSHHHAIAPSLSVRGTSSSGGAPTGASRPTSRSSIK